MLFRKLFLLSIFIFAVCIGVAYADIVRPCSCSAGYYCGDDSVCVLCRIGHYCINSNEQECSGNTYTAIRGMSECQICSGDTPYANEQHTGCTACNTDNFIVENDVCVACPSDQYANPEHTECVTCDDGIVEGGVCKPNCNPGEYLVDGQCVECTAGYYCVGGQTGRQICPKDTFSSAGQSECAKCPEGYTTDSEGTPHILGSKACKVKKAKLKIGNSETALPTYLRENKINRSVVRVKNN